MPTSEGPFSFNQVYLDELRALRPGAPPGADGRAAAVPDPFGGLAAEGFGDDSTAARACRASNLRELYHAVHGRLDGHDTTHRPLSALCFSGGGIRSATFNLGVLQALARVGLLGRFDYLSSVSGGGYISGWLAAWRRRATDEPVFDALAEGAAPANPHAPEPVPLDKLREYSNFLTPRTGTLSVDLWTAVAIVLRNVLLNWLVLLPVLAALVAIPQLCLLVVQLVPAATPPAWLWAPLGLGTGLLGNLAAFWIRTRRLRQVSEQGEARSAPSGVLVLAFLVPLWVSSAVTATAAIWTAATSDGPAVAAGARIPYALILLLFNPLLAWAVAGVRFAPRGDIYRPFWSELLALLVSGAVAALLLIVFHRFWIQWLAAHPAVFVAVAVPAVLATHLLATSLFLGLGSAGERHRPPHVEGKPIHGSAVAEMDREWWARHSGWVLIAALTWLLTSLLVLGAVPLVTGIAGWIAGVGGVSGAVVTLVGMSGRTSSGRRDDAKGSKLGEIVLRLAVPVFCASVVILLALGTIRLGRAVTDDGKLLYIRTDFGGELGLVSLRSALLFLGLMATLFAVGAAMAWAVNVNRFSLQALYRNRLVRAYLGASNSHRRPDPFTGFDPNDDFPLDECRDERPMPVINATLNLVRGAENLAWQQRKAESFSMSPLYCGNFHDGYRRSSEYAGGIRLGSAVAVSGAAANPNMGYHSSPAVTFLLTLLNARLGGWLGNTGVAGNRTFRYPGPRWALRPIFSELFGRTDSESPYVNLSDGGHFENLGLYEMVLRRCRYVVVCDAGQDPKASFDDLGNAIRKIRIDFRISVDFEERIHIGPRNDMPAGLYCAKARIRYSDVDPGGADGMLLYVKPALYREGRPVPYDVWAYAGSSPLFPHESTADQWFDESQFESYRALGLHAMEQITELFEKGRGLEEFFAAADAYLRSGGAGTTGPGQD